MSTKALYNYIDSRLLSVRNHHLKIKLRLSPKKEYQHKKRLVKSIEQRPNLINSRKTFGHCEIDSVIDLKLKDDNTLLALVERKTRHMITIVQNDHTEELVCYALKQLAKEFGQALLQSITAASSSEFSFFI